MEKNDIKLVVGKVPIVGFIDIQDISENSICDVNYELQNLIIKPNNVEEHSISVELETEINCQAYEQKDVNVVRDIYSPYDNIEIDNKQINAVSTKKVIREKNQIRQKIRIEGMEDKRILDVELSSVVQNENRVGTDVKFECEMELKFILFNNKTSKVEIKEGKIPFEFTTNIMEEQNNVSTSVEIEIGAQDYIVQTNDEINCSIDVIFNLGIETSSSIQVINNMQENGTRQMQEYSIIIYIVKSGDTLWKIAKRFGSTIEDIVRVNNIENENEIMIGQKLFIPRFYQNNFTKINKKDELIVTENG